jgi:hypothetical protein
MTRAAGPRGASLASGVRAACRFREPEGREAGRVTRVHPAPRGDPSHPPVACRSGRRRDQLRPNLRGKGSRREPGGSCRRSDEPRRHSSRHRRRAVGRARASGHGQAQAAGAQAGPRSKSSWRRRRGRRSALPGHHDPPRAVQDVRAAQRVRVPLPVPERQGGAVRDRERASRSRTRSPISTSRSSPGALSTRRMAMPDRSTRSTSTAAPGGVPAPTVSRFVRH